MFEALTVQQLAVEISDAQLARMPALARRYGAIGRQRCIEDTAFHLNYLAQAVELADDTLFSDYIAWVKVMLAARGVGEVDLIENLQEIRRAVARQQPQAAAIVERTIARVASMDSEIPTFLSPDLPLGKDAEKYLDLLLKVRRVEADTLLRELVRHGTPLEEIYLQIFEPVQHEIGRLWQMNRISVAQEHFCTAAVQRSMAALYSSMFTGAPGRRRVVAACAGEELHEVGLRMVTDLLELNGWDTVYLGANVPPESVVRTAAEAPTALVAISVTITPHLTDARNLIAALRAHPSTSSIPVIAGGYPFRISSGIAERIGADAWASNASEAVLRATELAGRLIA